MAGLVPAIPIGTRGDEGAFTRVFDALCPRVTPVGWQALWIDFHRDAL
jgi:hypothetical protein